jgi:hypothetical protein
MTRDVLDLPLDDLAACGSWDGSGEYVEYIGADPTQCITCRGVGVIDAVEHPFDAISFPRRLLTRAEYEAASAAFAEGLRAWIDDMAARTPLDVTH